MRKYGDEESWCSLEDSCTGEKTSNRLVDIATSAYCPFPAKKDVLGMWDRSTS